MTTGYEEEYQKRTLIEQILEAPDTFIGSVVRGEATERVYDLTNGKMMNACISIPEGQKQVFNEILTNASDNVQRSIDSNLDPLKIEVTVDEHTVVIKNYGRPITIAMNSVELTWNPTLIFGHLLTSSNYKKGQERLIAGKNGFGAKLTNIYSTYFKVDCADHVNQVRFQQEWYSNMSVVCDPVIEAWNESYSYVQVTYNLDFARFGTVSNDFESFCLYARYAADTSFTCKIPVTYSYMGNVVNFMNDNIETYSKLFFPVGCNVIMHNEEKVNMCIADTPDEGVCLPFVNGLFNVQGGVHADEAYKAVITAILEIINKNGKKMIKPSDIKPHISIIISCRLVNPAFSSQTKHYLNSPKPKITLADGELKGIKNWKLIDRIYNMIQLNELRKLQKTDGKKSKIITGIDAYESANKAGGHESNRCILFLSEGNSAAGMITKSFKIIGRDYNGIYPMRGKPLNVLNADTMQIFENKEITDIKKILGIRENMDYSIPDNYATLRYGALCIASDADVDGIHIRGLVMLLINRFPSLLKIGYVSFLRTPLILCKGTYFYTQQQFDNWRYSNQVKIDAKYINYKKGLGSFTEEETWILARDFQYVWCNYDDHAEECLRLAFDEKKSDERKAWMETRTIPFLDYATDRAMIISGTLNISQFFRDEFPEFMDASVQRAIPAIDGKKDVHRKIIWACKAICPDKAHSKKVARLASSIAEKTGYHHGEVSLISTIVGMAQTFVGSNNLSYFYKGGIFGTRNKGGKDAAQPRYIETYLEPWVFYVFRKEDEIIYDYRVDVEDEGRKVEPLNLYPIVPDHLINGLKGIACAWSTDIPSHDPLVIIQWLKQRNISGLLPELIPWYEGFTGEIIVKTSEKGIKSCSSYGKFSVTSPTTITITELPVMMWNCAFKKHLEDMVDAGTIKGFSRGNDDDCPHFEVWGYNTLVTEKQIIGDFGLRKGISMTNLVTTDYNCRLRKYKDVQEMMEEFYTMRLAAYEKRRLTLIEKLKAECEDLYRKAAFIQDVVDGKLIVFKRLDEDIYRDMDALGHNRELYNTVKLRACGQNMVDECLRLIEKKKLEVKYYEEIDIRWWYTQELEEFEKYYCRLKGRRSLPPPMKQENLFGGNSMFGTNSLFGNSESSATFEKTTQAPQITETQNTEIILLL